MTVGSPPSITATTLLVVPRSMPMILPMRGALLVGWFGFGWSRLTGGWEVGWLVDRAGGLARGCDRDERGTQDAVPEPVAPADLVDDLAFGVPAARDADDGLMIARVEGHAGRRLDRRHALALEKEPELAVDRRDP